MNFRVNSQTNNGQVRYAVAQGRVSSEDQRRKGVSLDAQRHNIEKWSTDNNVVILKESYFDHSAYRGLDEEQEFLDLIEFAKNDRRVSLFLVDEKSRFARSRYTRIVYEEELRRAGVKIHAVSEPNYDTKTVHGVWMDGISITKNEAMSIEIAYHTRKGMKENVSQRDQETGYCYKNGGPPAYGYKHVRVTRGKDRRGKDLVKLIWDIDEERGGIVRQIVIDYWLRKKWSWKMIRDWLNGQSIPSPRGGLWGISTIREICIRALEGEYTGTAFWNRTGKDMRGGGQKWKDPEEWIVVEDAHPVIISPEELQELKAERGPEMEKRKGTNGTGVPKNMNSRWLLSGLNAMGEPFFRCLNGDDHSFVGNQVHEYLFYICNKYKNYGPAGCDKPLWIKKEFEKDVVNAIIERFTDERIRELVEQVNGQLAIDQNDFSEARKHIEKEMDKNDRETKTLMEAIKSAGAKGKIILLGELESLAEQKDALVAQMGELSKERPQIKPLFESDIKNKIKSIEKIMESGTNKDKRDIIRVFIHSIEMDPGTETAHINFFADPFPTKIKTGNLKDLPVRIFDGGDTQI